MRRAIELAKRGIGRVNPNPLVGAVIVKDGRIIAEGYHARYGDLHAERHAFSKLTEDAAGAEMYVTLEPCCHHGKQPPCTEAIIEHGISKVYVGSDDPNALVAGRGIARLCEAGITVETHVLQEECDALNPVFFHYISTQTPYVVMKYAMTMDGKIACETGASKWVTGEKAREHVQETRNWLTSIMVGVQTVLQDNPRLTCRLPEGRNPIRIVCDSHLRIPENCDLVQTAKETPLIVATLESSLNLPQADKLRDQGVDLIGTAGLDGRIDLQDLMRQLGEQKIDSILLEWGVT
ncbi:MAG: bifunctional diaminohydroxyphosphoribosylaminopyrimidine deaminase/5-amino-6-(5-phosphoribosylamino)uracil reductase RibD, partial [Lachnospiraceae bacterium]|nr:bifunctional diaminohydroxyphosphoribosylaminopyrimidine deaminase/5-amino-6-(5-phosphoribosylamino)uracil reductase RibD [Lachnospiraceae bacterium]